MKKDKGYKIQIAEDYFTYRNYSRKFDRRLISEYDQTDLNPINLFIDDIYSSLKIESPKRRCQIKKEALNSTITNSIVGMQEGKLLAFPRAKEVYAHNSFYGPEYYSHSYIVGGADALIEANWLEQINGYYDRERKKGEYARLRPSRKLIDEINCRSELKIYGSKIEDEEPCRIHYLLGKKLKRRRLKNPIVLKIKKNEKKYAVEYQSNDKILKMRLFLNEYNDLLDKNMISIPEYILKDAISSPFNPEFQTTTNPIKWYDIKGSIPLLSQEEFKCNSYIVLDCWTYRVFNNGRFDEGGRFYGGEYQSLSEEQRKEILINGNPTIELDYKALHPRMIYHLEGIDYKGDPYRAVISAECLRDAVKKMMQIMINADNEREAIYAFEDYLDENPDIKNIVYENGLDGRELLRLIKDKHKRIENYFNTGIGVELQYRDSKIAERILKYFTKKEIVCLCVHDSFIVERQYKDELYEIMKKEYKREMGFEGEVD